MGYRGGRRPSVFRVDGLNGRRQPGEGREGSGRGRERKGRGGVEISAKQPRNWIAGLQDMRYWIKRDSRRALGMRRGPDWEEKTQAGNAHKGAKRVEDRKSVRAHMIKARRRGVGYGHEVRQAITPCLRYSERLLLISPRGSYSN